MPQEVPPVPDLAALLKRPVPDNVYGTLARTFVPAELGRVVPATENYVTHMPFVSKGTNYFLVLTDTKLYQVSDTLAKKRKVWDLKEIRSITGDDEHIVLTLVTRVGSDDVHQEQKVLMGEQFPCQSFPFLFANRSRVVWQQYLESKIVPAPEVYQCHFFVAYQETPKKKTGACVVLSTAAVFVCTLKSGLPAAVKDRFAADKLTALAAVPGNDRAVRLTLGDATPVCVAATADERNALTYELRRLVWDTRKVSLPVQNS